MVSLLGENIKKERLKAGLSMEKLSKAANVGISTISEIENGKRQSLRSETIEKIAASLNVSVNVLFGIRDVEEGSYIVSDLLDIINIILNDDEISIDGKVMTENEKSEFIYLTEMYINNVISKRSK
ncbi:helix-turn-helix domain-containing protein [uncultured Clostridium sp.]|jgi:DNA-binding protein|uniref:helix-turn-helix domain-containing protein n=1 Tax=uncultured Clostridium sp. TaxID=59620 RepID=UPI0025D3A42B|nr:helix-turn-helix transcriptional regulator [uncultured Clostridium sp.]